MTDDDKATEREEQHREWAMKHRMPGGPRPNGSCHYCGEPAPPGAQFCGRDCADDWAREPWALRQNKGKAHE